MKNSRNVYVERKKSKNGVAYIVLYADMGYGKCNITMDTAIIAELSNMTFEQINNLEFDKSLLVFTLNKVGE